MLEDSSSSSSSTNSSVSTELESELGVSSSESLEESESVSPAKINNFYSSYSLSEAHFTMLYPIQVQNSPVSGSFIKG